MAREYILTDIKTKQGRLNNTYIHDLTWLDPEDLTIYMTIVDESYRNYTRSGWDRIIDLNQLGVYTGLIRTAKRNTDNLQVLSADSYPQLVDTVTDREIEQFVDVRQQQLGLR